MFEIVYRGIFKFKLGLVNFHLIFLKSKHFGISHHFKMAEFIFEMSDFTLICILLHLLIKHR